MNRIDWDPSSKTLRDFGFIGIAGFTLIGLVFHYKFGLPQAAYAFWALAVVCPLLSMTKPTLLRPLFVGMSLVAVGIGFVLSQIILGLLYYGLFTPIGLFFRITKRDALTRRLDPEAKTYWIDRPKQRPPADYYRQF